MRTRANVDLLMGLCEDGPELIIDVTFVALGGLTEATSCADSSGAEIAIFALSSLLTVLHLFKCMWTWLRIRKMVSSADELMEEGSSRTAEDLARVYGVEGF